MTFAAWSKSYRELARLDGHLKLLAWRERDGFEARLPWARRAVRDTVSLVRDAVSSLLLDGDVQAVDRLLHLQTYDPAGARARYLLVFEAGSFPWSRLYVDDLRQADLDHLYRSAGFSHLTIRRIDGKNLPRREVDALKAAVRNDFGADGCTPEEEVTPVFEQDADRLHVVPRDVEESEPALPPVEPRRKPSPREHDEILALRLIANGGGSHPLREHPWYDEAAISFSLEEPDEVSVFLRRQGATRRRFDFRIVPTPVTEAIPERVDDVPRDVGLEAGKRFLHDTIDILHEIPGGLRRDLLGKALTQLREEKRIRGDDARLLEALLRVWPENPAT